MNNEEITGILDTYPDLVAKAQAKWKTAKVDLENLAAKLYLSFKAESIGKEKTTVRDIEAEVKASVEHYKAAIAEVVAESEYTALNEKLMAAKREATMRTSF